MNTPTAPHEVTQPRPEEQQAAEDEGVGVLHPGQRGGAQIQSRRDGRQAGEDDRVVEQDQEVADQDDGQDRRGCHGGRSLSTPSVLRVSADGYVQSREHPRRPRESRSLRVPAGPPSTVPRLSTVGRGRQRRAGRDPRVPDHPPGKITPEQAGLPAYGGNRRVTGLRREEVALLAGV